MKIRFLRLIALVLTAACCCPAAAWWTLASISALCVHWWMGTPLSPTRDMTYERPDMTQLGRRWTPPAAAEGDDVSAILTGYDFYDAYDWFSTYYALADIHYCADLMDTYWEVEYNYCTPERGHGGRRLYRSFTGRLPSPPPGRNWSRRNISARAFLTAMRMRKASGTRPSPPCWRRKPGCKPGIMSCPLGRRTIRTIRKATMTPARDGMASLLAELIAVRQEIAEYCGYSDYPQFAEDFYFYWDYTAAEEEKLPGRHPPGAGAAVPSWTPPTHGRRPVSTLLKGRPFNYLATAAEGMGGTVKEAHDLMKTAKLYDTGYGENGHTSLSNT